MSVFPTLNSTSQMLNTSPPSSSVSPTAAVSSGCCTTGRPVLADPVTGQTVCSCQLESAAAAGRVLSSYPRLAAAAAAAGVAGGGVAGAMASYPLPTEAAGYAGLTDQAVATAALYANLGGAYEMKDTPGALAGLGAPPPYFHPYDPSSAAMYPYANGYCGLDFNSAAHRKNATREATNTLKAWLNEHKKNPYPTKGEKIMLAIITKMTLTQVSTWFANARRRLKKENKMTWEPRNRTDDDDDGDDVEKANESNNEDIDISTQISDRDSSAGSISPGVSENELDTASKLLQHRASLFPGHVPVPPDSIPLGFSAASAAATGIDRSLKLIPSLPPAPASASALVPPESATKPRIWSLADTAMSRSTSLTPISVAALSPQLGGPPIPIPAAAAASPSLYPYSSAFSPLKPWLGVPYPVVSLASPLGLAAVVSRAHMTPYDVTSSALSSRLAAAAAAALTPNITSTIAPDPQTPGKPCQPRPRNSPSFSDSDGDNPKARAHSNSSARAVSSQSPPTSKFSVTELCRKDDQSIKTKLKIDQ